MPNRLTVRFGPLVPALLLVAWASSCQAQAPAADPPDALLEQATPAALAGASRETVRLWLAAAERQRTALRTAHQADQARHQAVADALAALGPPAEDTALEQEERGRLESERERLELALASGDARLRQLDDLLDRLELADREAARRQLVRAGDALPAVLGGNLAAPGLWTAFLANLSTDGSGAELVDGGTLGLGLLVLLIGAGLARWIRRGLRHAAGRVAADSFTGSLLIGALASGAVHVPYALLLGVVAGFMSYVARGQEHLPYGVTLCYAALAWVVVRTGLRTALAPYPPAPGVLAYERALQLRLARGLSVLCLLILLYALLGRVAWEFGLAEAGLNLLRVVFIVALTADAALLVGLEKRLTGRARSSRTAALALLGVALLAELLGYRGLADFVQQGVILSLLLALALWAARRVLGELFDRLDAGRDRPTAWLRGALAVPDGGGFPGLPSLRFAAGLALYAGGGLLLLRVWALPAGFHVALSWLNDGFALADSVVIPSRLFWGLELFALLLGARAIVRGWADGWLARSSRLDRGARDATVAVIDYAGFAVAALGALRVVGPELARNLAVVAGALSVGIGFGLQNIVNNFVSGLILLFERRIQAGDTIAVGDTAGTVRRLSVRATEIVTGDGSQVIVPNSDLITRAVTNRTRAVPAAASLSVKVRAAPGANAAEVARLLAELARGHAAVVVDEESPEVLFTEFGAGGPAFEIRAGLRQGAAAERVRSDVLFAVETAFRQRGLAPGG